MANVNITRNKDNTYTVKVGRKIADQIPGDLSKHDLFERIKWAAIMYGAPIPDITVVEALYNL